MNKNLMLKQAKLGLIYYRDRGQRALSLLIEGKVDAALLELRWRRAAWQNFVVAEHHLSAAAIDITLDQEFIIIERQLEGLDLELKKELEKAKKIEAQNLKKEQIKRSTIVRFKSGNAETSSFKSII